VKAEDSGWGVGVCVWGGGGALTVRHDKVLWSAAAREKLGMIVTGVSSAKNSICETDNSLIFVICAIDKVIREIRRNMHYRDGHNEDR